MLSYKIKRSGNDRVIHIILEDNYFEHAPVPRPATEKEIIDFCRETLAGFKLPKKVVFCDLPKTSKGKIQKFELRKKAKELN